jgi:hypothetical protein
MGCRWLYRELSKGAAVDDAQLGRALDGSKKVQ